MRLTLSLGLITAGGMPRPLRMAMGGLVYHVLNRANAGMQIFDGRGDYHAFEATLAEAVERVQMRVLSYCVMPNHWHLILWPREDGDLSRFMAWLTLTHTQRWHAYRRTAGSGHVYQGRFKSFVVDTDEYFMTVCRYVERNPIRAKLVTTAEEWQWASPYHRQRHDELGAAILSDWPGSVPGDWAATVNESLTQRELDAVRHSVVRGCPYGSPNWVQRIASRLGLESTLRPRGRQVGSSRKRRKTTDLWRDN